MLDALVSWSLRSRALVLLMTLVLVGLGARAATRLPIDAVPDVTNVQVQVITTAPALSPLEIEKYVSIPVERAMSGIPRVTEVRSLSKYGISLVTIVFEDDVDIWFARQLVGERMSHARDAVGEFGAPEMGPVSTALGEIYQFTVRNDAKSAMELEEMLDWEIAPQLRMVPGVVELNSMGGLNRQYTVTIDPIELQALGLTVGQVVEAIERSNANAGGGYVEHAGEQIVIGTVGLIGGIDDLSRVVLGATPQGAPITVGMVGDVAFGARLRHGAVSMDGEGEVVVGVVMMTIGENARTVTTAVEAKLAELLESLPEGTRIEPFYDRARLVDRTIATVATNLGEGALLVVVVLLALLGDLRAGLVVAVTIPLSMAFAVICMDLLGISGNLMSLGAIDFGLIVDGAVIVVENAARRLGEARAQGGAQNDRERTDIVRSATLEVRRATVYGEAVVAIVYVPILALRGIEGKLFQPMATVVLLALAGAFVLSLTVVPVLTSLVLRPRPHHETWILRVIARGYRPVLARALKVRVVVITLAVAALAGGAMVARDLGAEFVPTLDEGDLLIEGRRLPGVGLTQTLAMEDRLQKALMQIPEVEHTVSKIGAPELPADAMGLNQTDVYISLKDRDVWRDGLTKAELGEEIAEVAEAAVPDFTPAISQPIQMRQNEMLAGIRSDVGIIVYGQDFGELQRIAASLGEAVGDIPGVDGLQIEELTGLNYLRIIPDRRALARHELRVADVNLLAESLAVGHGSGVVLEGDRRFDIVVKTRHAFAGDVESIAALPMRTPSGRVVALGDVAAVALVEGPAMVNRDAQSRRLVVQLNVRGRDLVSTVEDCIAAVAKVPRPDGYRVVFGGTFAHWLEARDRLAVLIPIVLAAIFVLLWMAFGELGPALVIASGVPFATLGGVLALAIRGIPFSISAAVGFIALFGVAVLNGLVLVSVARRFETQGHTRIDAVVAACEQRLRPVLTTALVAALGFVPMAISTAPGSEVQRPLATVVIGGLISATLLTLVVMPALYSLGRKRRA
ncbi:MAG TPA: CusA/CzcA family heavy metal efflux RND transporter [Nannocystaceae bacterium]|nr:CusA/CzcA family heavy metal efflux RND transporter [Nannocystaceae bacterium]